MKTHVLLSLGAAVLVGLGMAYNHRLPDPELLRPEVLSEPLQTAAPSSANFSVRAGGVDYRIEPVADYDISGIVVSRHDTSVWWNWIHKASNDHLNAVDLCMVWGANARDGVYQRMSFSSGQFVCYYTYSDAETGKHIYLRALSNNHLLSEDPRIVRRLRALRVGDQVRVRGHLASYRHNAGFEYTRGTSLTRDDGGNGACETIYVRDVMVLRAAPAWPRMLLWLGALLAAAAVVAWWKLPHRSRA